LYSGLSKNVNKTPANPKKKKMAEDGVTTVEQEVEMGCVNKGVTDSPRISCPKFRTRKINAPLFSGGIGNVTSAASSKETEIIGVEINP
jgi:hypothetical protein